MARPTVCHASYIDWESTKLFLTTDEAAVMLRTTQANIQKRITSGKIRASKATGHWLISKDDLREFIESSYNVPKTA